jgi:hypothetical protein
MSRAPKKKKSLYDGFYGKWPEEYETTVNKAMKSVEEQMKDYALRLDEMMKRNAAKNAAQAPTSHTKTYRNDLEKLRDTIRKGAKKDNINELVDDIKRKANAKQPAKVQEIDEVVRFNNHALFTKDTHKVELALRSANYYSEQITTKIVGMETVDWWEYVLIYGFVKSFKLGYEYTKVKDLIQKGVQSSRTVSGQNLEIKFIPKKKNDVKRVQDTVDGKPVIRVQGVVYEPQTICLEVPQKSEQRKEEYRRGYFVYEDTFSTLVIDYDALREQIDQMLTD